jgi:hypothetical protein
MKYTKTDHNEQSLALLPNEKNIMRHAIEAMLEHQSGSVEMRDQALKMLDFLNAPDKEDKPAIFWKTHGTIANCPDCAGANKTKVIPEDNESDVEYPPCNTCQGIGQLYLEITRKYHLVTETHRRKLAK